MLHINDHTAHRYYSHLSCGSGIKNRYNKNTIVCNLLKMIIISINCPLLDRVSIFNMHLDEQVKTDQAQEPSFSWRLFACLSLKIQYSSPLWTGAEVHDRHGVYRLWPCSVVVGPPSGPSYISLLSPLSSTASKPLGFHCYGGDSWYSWSGSCTCCCNGAYWLLCLLQGLMVWLMHTNT